MTNQAFVLSSIAPSAHWNPVPLLRSSSLGCPALPSSSVHRWCSRWLVPIQPITPTTSTTSWTCCVNLPTPPSPPPSPPPPATPTPSEPPVAKSTDRPSFAEQSRTIVEAATYCSLATFHNSAPLHLTPADPAQQWELMYPFNSMLELASDGDGCPVFGISTLSFHTKDLMRNPRASVCVTAPGFASIQDARVTLVGTCERAPDSEQLQLKEIYRAKHPNAFWLDFGDFAMYRMKDIQSIRFVGGFGRAGDVKPSDYKQASPDPLLPFANRVMDHMNDDHVGDLIKILNHYAPPPKDNDASVKEIISAKMIAVDKVGMDLLVVAKVISPNDPTPQEEKKQNWRQRIKFPYPALDRKAIKEVLVEMTKASANS